jgi:hypothetical protein
MTIATMPRGVRMRPIASPDDSFTAAAILAQAATDDLDAFRNLVPSGTTPNPVEIAEDGSAAIFEVHVVPTGMPTAAARRPRVSSYIAKPVRVRTTHDCAVGIVSRLRAPPWAPIARDKRHADAGYVSGRVSNCSMVESQV